jgi:hypothetical protein
VCHIHEVELTAHAADHSVIRQTIRHGRARHGHLHGSIHESGVSSLPPVQLLMME